jgi:DNA primase
VSIDFAAVRERHPLSGVVRRSGYALPADAHGDVFIACPMPGHDDSTPSMLLHLDEGRYHCFGCDASGDVVQWICDIYGLDTRDALTILDAESEPFPKAPGGAVQTRRGATRPRVRAEGPDLTRTSTERARQALTAAWRFYTLPRLAEKAGRYLVERGIDVSGLGEVAGHTPHDPDQLVTHLRKRGFSDDELVDAGLARRRDDEPLADLFQHRVVLAVRDERDAVIGLIGRSTLNASRAPKYFNSPLTITYNKRQVLYSPSRVDLADDGQIVIVEGSLDALAIAAAAHQAGREDRFWPVCTSGLAYSDAQVTRLLTRHSRPPVIALDGDEAGRRAGAQLAAKIARQGREATIVTWPDGEDPASWLAHHGPDGLTAVTRRGCLEADSETLRPRHAGADATRALLGETRGPLDRRVAMALAPIERMTDRAATRYAEQAAKAIAPVVVAAVASTSTHHRGRLDSVLDIVASYSKRFPAAAQARFVELAVCAIETQQLAPGGWAERQITTRIAEAERIVNIADAQALTAGAARAR